MAKVIYSDVAAINDLQGDLFRGIKFWLSQRVPQRSRFIADINASDHSIITGRAFLTFRQANGGKVVPLDKQADVIIVDHARKEAPLGSYVSNERLRIARLIIQ